MKLLARSQRQTIQHYTSDRVFDGTRPVSAARLAKLKASYQRTHTTVVHLGHVGTYVYEEKP